MKVLTLLAAGLIVFMAAGLLIKSWPIMGERPLADLLLGRLWRPLRGSFGFLPFIAGTAAVTLTAVVIAVPLSLLTSLYLSEYAHRRVRAVMAPVIDVLAGIPSVIFGVWGIMTVVPFIKNNLAPLFGVDTSGFCVLSGGVVLAVMICPLIVNVSCEVLRAIPRELREASLSLGATRWQTTRKVVLRRALPGIMAANVLGLSRALGETMAVLMVVGNRPDLPASPFDPAYPLPALIANSYGEVMSIPLFDSALMFAALLLFAMVVAFSVISRLVLLRLERLSG